MAAYKHNRFEPRPEPTPGWWTAIFYILVFWFFADALRIAFEAL